MWPVLARKPFPVLGAVWHSTVNVWHKAPQVNECYFVLWCINDTCLSWLVGTSGGLNDLRYWGDTGRSRHPLCMTNNWYVSATEEWRNV